MTIGPPPAYLAEPTGAMKEDESMDVVEVMCPTCGEPTVVDVPLHDGRLRVAADCQVCCRPLSVMLEVRAGEVQRADVEFGW